jgi:hypothetical protein
MLPPGSLHDTKWPAAKTRSICRKHTVSTLERARRKGWFRAPGHRVQTSPPRACAIQLRPPPQLRRPAARRPRCCSPRCTEQLLHGASGALESPAGGEASRGCEEARHRGRPAVTCPPAAPLAVAQSWWRGREQHAESAREGASAASLRAEEAICAGGFQKHARERGFPQRCDSSAHSGLTAAQP